LTPTADGAGMLTVMGPYGAIMEPNVGQAFAIPPTPNDVDANYCRNFANGFGEDPSLTNNVLDLRDIDLSLYTVFRPAKWKQGEKFPLITWGNGTCAQPGSYGALLMHVASHGFIVVAANGRFVANGAQLKALDFMFAANEDAASPYYQRLDTTRVGAMGHSQGSITTAAAANDPRISSVILFNGGQSAAKPFLAISGDRDIGGSTATSMGSAASAAPKGAFIFYHQVPMTGGTLTGHLTLMMEPNRVVDATTGWWQLQFNSDAKARALFVGASCGLCGRNAEFEYGEHGLD
jgi:hypothetical protein